MDTCDLYSIMNGFLFQDGFLPQDGFLFQDGSLFNGNRLAVCFFFQTFSPLTLPSCFPRPFFILSIHLWIQKRMSVREREREGEGERMIEIREKEERKNCNPTFVLQKVKSMDNPFFLGSNYFGTLSLSFSFLLLLLT